MEAATQEQSKAKQLGKLRVIYMDLTKPVPMKGKHLDVGIFTLMTGKNGTGKSFIMKLTWCLTSIATVMIAAKGMPSEAKIGMAQFYFDSTFVDNNLDGIIKVEYEGGATIDVVLKDGKITQLNEQIEPNLVAGSHPKYLSSNMRLMIEVQQYMKLKAALGIPKGMPATEEHINKLLDSYRLYDIMHAENVLLAIDTRPSDPEFLKFINEKLETGEDQFILKGIKVDYEKNDIKYLDKDDLWLSIATMGAGHQALLNMFIVQ